MSVRSIGFRRWSAIMLLLLVPLSSYGMTTVAIEGRPVPQSVIYETGAGIVSTIACAGCAVAAAATVASGGAPAVVATVVTGGAAAVGIVAGAAACVASCVDMVSDWGDDDDD